MPESLLRQAPDACEEVLGDEIVVYLPEARTLHRLDAIAAQVWAHFAEPTWTTHVINELIASFPESEVDVRREVPALLADMTERGLLTEGGQETEPQRDEAVREDLLQIT